MSLFIYSSPGVGFTETDKTGIVPVTGNSGSATVGDFSWGPVEFYTYLANAQELESIFGKPTNTNFPYWFSSWCFLAYTGNLNQIRVIDENAINSTDDGTGFLIKNINHFEIVRTGTIPTGMYFAARYPGSIGDSIGVSIADQNTYDTWEYKNEFDFAPGTSEFAASMGASADEVHVVVYDVQGKFTGYVGTILERYSFLSKAFDAKDANNGPSYYVSVINKSSQYVWAMAPLGGALVTDEVGGKQVERITVTDGGTGYTTAVATIAGDGAGATAKVTMAAGVITGIEVLNKGTGYTSATVTITGDGTGATADAVVSPVVTNAGSDWGTPLLVNGVPSEYSVLVDNYTKAFTGGADSSTIGAQELIQGFEMLVNAETIKVGSVFVGPGGIEENEMVTTIQWVIDNVSSARKDCVAFFSPPLQSIISKTKSEAITNLTAFRQKVGRANTPGSYAFMDSGWGMVYDVYNNVYRWVPLCAHTAGLSARTDNDADPWYSPAGYTRGNLKNVVSLAFNPDKQARDVLYKVGINSIVAFPNDGTILYGDRTLQGKDSAFQFLGTRKLFIILEQSISEAAKSLLFEFNDEYTRAGFISMVEPYLREVKGRRGIDDFKVICDETNNSAEVIMHGQFVGDIYIKPQYSIQWVQLNFVAVRRDVAFSEVVGAIV